MTFEEIYQITEELEFSQIGKINMDAISFLPEVRDMCAAGKCHAYGHSWVCPPAIGSLDEAAAKASAYQEGILLQSIGQLEDEFDVECMMETERVHQERFAKLVHHLRVELELDCLPMSAGSCRVCKTCTYPSAPCRFPEKAIPSMEAYGLWVSQVCDMSQMKYNYGKNTIAYTSCVLF